MAGQAFAHVWPGAARLRCSPYRHLGRLGLTVRIIPPRVPTLDELHLPQVVADIALARRGLTLVTGARGSGRSAALAAMLGVLNSHCAVKIITFEEPVEYIHTGARALIAQREIGRDVPTAAAGLAEALRQDADVLMVDELNGGETLRLALRAADAGQQVLLAATSADAPQAVARLMALFPPGEKDLLRAQLGGQLEAVVALRLVATLAGDRRPAVEVLRGTSLVEKLIVENRPEELTECLRSGESGMQSFDQHLLGLYNDRVISGTEALRRASRPEALSVAMRSIGGVP